MLDQLAYLRPIIKTGYLVVLALLMITLPMRNVPTIHAATFWYVAPDGSDASDCRTLAAPCKAISSVIARSTNGDTIVLGSGTYPETLTITKSLTLVGASAETTAIDGQGTGRVLTVQAPAQLTVNGVTIQNGNAFSRSGGGIYNDYGTITLNNSVVRNNSVFIGAGGGIYNTGALTLVHSTVEDNFAPFSGGGIYNTEGMITINESTIRRNRAEQARSVPVGTSGGGILNNGRMIVNKSTISGNQSYSSFGYDSGGGIENRGILMLAESMINDNGTIVGGGIDNAGVLIVEDSTITGNTANRFVPRSYGGFGGGINNEGSLTITNSTISNNSADDSGGGMRNTDVITLTNVTVSGNNAGGQGGGISHLGGTVKLWNSILAANSNAIAPDCEGTLISQGYNLVGDTTGCVFLETLGDQVGTGTDPIDPRLGLLQYNGGPTMTQKLLSNSPAIDAANPAEPGSDGAACPIADQRGFRRPQGNGCDIGAYELGRTYFLPFSSR